MVDAQAALRELHDAYAATLWRYVVHLCGSTSAADDVVQETLLRAWRSPGILEQDPATVRSWMFTVARHLVIDEARSARRRHEVGVGDPPERPSADRTDELFERLLIEDALATLTADHRAIVVAAYFEGRSTSELAAEFDIPEGTAKSRLHYALRALRLAMQERGVTR
ncbi:sigma-70 family RNA polymerase sigma factor [Agromyces sp. MMS24-JH15]|uniref:sigma-70 family RNA polymerase sigma factor n=1 Tax=Agromyces sp. MMS24-JH15 TaxID=3243765 RepID=UPI00374A318E